MLLVDSVPLEPGLDWMFSGSSGHLLATVQLSLLGSQVSAFGPGFTGDFDDESFHLKPRLEAAPALCGGFPPPPSLGMLRTSLACVENLASGFLGVCIGSFFPIPREVSFPLEFHFWLVLWAFA